MYPICSAYTELPLQDQDVSDRLDAENSTTFVCLSEALSKFEILQKRIYELRLQMKEAAGERLRIKIKDYEDSVSEELDKELYRYNIDFKRLDIIDIIVSTFLAADGLDFEVEFDTENENPFFKDGSHGFKAERVSLDKVRFKELVTSTELEINFLSSGVLRIHSELVDSEDIYEVGICVDNLINMLKRKMIVLNTPISSLDTVLESSTNIGDKYHVVFSVTNSSFVGEMREYYYLTWDKNEIEDFILHRLWWNNVSYKDITYAKFYEDFIREHQFTDYNSGCAFIMPSLSF